MMKNVIVNIKGTQGLDGEEETIELTTQARFGIKDGEILISYDEGEMLGVNGVKTMLHYKAPDTVVLKRSGALESRLVIQRHKRNSCLYNTGFGDLLLDIYGVRLDTDLKETGGSLFMEYTIEADNRPLSKNKVEITVREV